MFQCKVIHNILRNQVSLFRAGIANNDTCPLFNTEKQTSNHMLYSCPETTTFWGQFTDWWYQKFKQNLMHNFIWLPPKITERASSQLRSSPCKVS